MTEKIIDSLNRLRENHPLVCCMTNSVVMEFNANSLLALGALPVMTFEEREIEEMVFRSDALYVNIGTLKDDEFVAIFSACKTARDFGKPVILDPVGAGATSYRLEKSLEIMSMGVDIVKGNGGEIEALLGMSPKMRGVTSLGTESKKGELCKKLGKEYNCVVCVTGSTDYISDGGDVYEIHNGVPILDRVVGTGCTCGALIGAFAPFGENFTVSALGGLAIMSVAGELAFEKSGNRPGIFKTELIDAFYNMESNIIRDRLNITKEV